MTQYNILNIKVPNSQLNKLKSGTKNGTEVTLKLSWNVVGDFNGKNFLYELLLTNPQVSKLCELLLTDTQVSKLRKAFANGSSANIRLWKIQLHKIEQSGGFLDRLLGPLLKTGLPLMKNALKSFAKSVSIPLGLTTPAATDAAIQKIFWSGSTKLITSNEEMNDIEKIINFLEESGLLMKCVSKTTKKWSKRRKGWFLGASLSGNLLAGTGKIRTGEGTIRAGLWLLMGYCPPPPLQIGNTPQSQKFLTLHLPHQVLKLFTSLSD